MTMRWERQGWLLAWAASMMWVGGSGMVAAQEPAPGTDARLTVTASIAAATQEADDAAFQEADDSEVEAGGDETQLRQQIQALNVLLREYEQKLRGMSLRRQVDRVSLQRTLAERAMEEAQLAQRVQELLLNGQAAGGRYWLGVQTIPLSDLNQEMRDELKLEEGASGVVIDAVVEESPAAAAGLQRMDVIVRANDQPVEDVGGLIEIVARVDGNKLTLEVVRSGEELEVQVTPVERPITFTIPQEGYRLENFSVMRGFAPGAAGVTQLSLKTVEIPDGMSLQVTRHGNEPAQIKVDFEGESYEVTSESLDTLPESIREQVRAALSGIDEGAKRGRCLRGRRIGRHTHILPGAIVSSVARLVVREGHVRAEGLSNARFAVAWAMNVLERIRLFERVQVGRSHKFARPALTL